MADEMQEFVHESMQDRDSLVRYLTALMDGLQHGRLLLASNGERLEMKTPPFVKFDLQAKNKRNRSQIVLKISWKNSTAKPELKVEPLQIEAKDSSDHA